MKFLPTKYYWILFLIYPIAISCNSSENEFIQPSSFQIYIEQFNNEEEVFASHVTFNHDSSQIMVFGVSGQGLQNKFEGQKLHILALETQGNNQVIFSQDTALVEDIGFPSTPVVLNNQFYLLWNRTGVSNFYPQLGVRIDSEGNSTVISRDTTLQYFTTHLISNLNNTGFVGMGVGTDFEENNAVFINQFSSNFQLQNRLYEQTFSPGELDLGVTNDLSIIERLDNYLFLQKIGNTYFFNAPRGPRLSAGYTGENRTFFDSQSDQWLLAASSVADSSLFVVSKSLNDIQSTFGVNLSVDESYSAIPLPSNGSPSPIFNLRNDSNVFIETIPNRNRVLVAGTNLSDVISLRSFNMEGKLVKEVTLGEGFQYELEGMLVNGQDIFLVGNTNVAVRYQRIFMLKIPLGQLL